MGTNFHTAWDNTTLFKPSSMNTVPSSLDQALTYQKVILIHCDGALDYIKTTGALTWSGTLRIHFIRSDGQAIQNTVNAGNITLADNEFAYVDLNETNNTVVTVQKAAITTGAAATFKAYNRVMLAYRNSSSDELYPVELTRGWTSPSSALPERNATISLFPEFPGSVLTKSGTANDPGGEGMTSDLDVSGNTFRPYYEWSSDVTGAIQSYDVFVQWRVPPDFKSFQVGTNQALQLEICTEENTTTNNKIDVTLQKDGSATTSSLTAQKSDVAATWKQVGFDETDAVISSLAAGDVLNIRIRLYSFNSKWARVGKIDLAAVLQ
jgi:hypothetical protein